jgi:hypothetical protein
MAGALIDTGSQENYFNQVDISGATLNPVLLQGATQPQYFWCRKCSPGLGFGTAFNLQAGSYVNIDDSNIGAGFQSTSSGIATGASFNSAGNIQGLSVVGGAITGSGTWGIELAGGHNTVISGVAINGGSSGGVDLDGIGYATINGNSLVGGGSGNCLEADSNPGHVVAYGNNCTGTFTNVINGTVSSGSFSTSNNF